MEWRCKYCPADDRRAGARRARGFVCDIGECEESAGGNAKNVMRFCRKTTYCPNLRDGRIYTCAQAYHIKDYIKLYEKETGQESKMVPSAGIDVYCEANDGWSILKYLMTPCETCRFCADSFRYITWSNKKSVALDWAR